MGRFLPLFLSIVGTLHVIGVAGESAAECIGRCTNQIRDKFADLQCADANAAPCFCKNPTFPRAILECSQSCGATADMISGYLTSNFCAGQELAKPSQPGAAAPPTSPTPAPSTTTPAIPTASAVSSSTTAAQAAPSTTPSATPSPTSSQIDSASSTSTGISSSATPETTSSSTTPASPSTTSDAPSSSTSSAAAAADLPSPGLSQAAIAGIGTGIGAAVLAIAGFIVCALMKSRKKNSGHRTDKIEISKPMPGSGRTYPTREDQYRAGPDASFEKYGPDIEMTANRYEDMVPRTQPRTMV
ncbi:hypothetical protein E4U21_005752 [Claviceps maximensis]|nr:hypothetical protein E4U21_005752 [Claviceps maximensis]